MMMGMYTEFFFTGRLENLSEDDICIINYMLGKADKLPSNMPTHDLFKTDRWSFMLRSSSYYFTPRNMNLFEYDDISQEWCLVSYSSFKNYGNEIELFLDWIKPFIEAQDGEMVGYSRYEECDNPTIHFAPSAS